MKSHETLIRKLVDLTAKSELQGWDSIEVLKNRCFNDSNIVRRTLMNAVCDPRFKFKAGTGSWERMARTALSDLDILLIAENNLTEERANELLEGFWQKWIKQLLQIIPVAAPKGSLSMLRTPDHHNKNDISEIDLFIDNLKSLAKSNTTKPEEDDTSDGEVGENDDSYSENQDSDEERPIPPHPMPGKGVQRNIAAILLKKIPKSLVDLARKIGRAGDTKFSKLTSNFEKASKSDITGITVGDDLSAILPSELALLAEPSTEKIFLHNMAAKRLQLFASASHSASENKHQDGPVIICLDTSGSMSGLPLQVAVALTAAVAIISWRRHRDVLIVKYSDSYEYFDAGNSVSKLAQVLTFLKWTEGGGNNENEMFQWLFTEVKPDLKTYKTSDILCISDFGWTSLDKETIELIDKQKAMGTRFYGLNVERHAFDNLGQTSGSFTEMESMNVCDSLWIYANDMCKEVRSAPEPKPKRKSPYRI